MRSAEIVVSAVAEVEPYLRAEVGVLLLRARRRGPSSEALRQVASNANNFGKFVGISGSSVPLLVVEAAG